MYYSYEFKKECVELYRLCKYYKTPAGIFAKEFHKYIRKWYKFEELHGPEILKHVERYKDWSPNEKYEVIVKVLAENP